MGWYYNLKIRTKLLTAFILISLLTGIVGFIGIQNIKTINSNYTDLYVNYGMAITDIGQVGFSYHDNRSTVRDIIFGSTDIASAQEKIKQQDKNLEEHLLKAEKSLQTEEGQRVFNDLKEALAQYNEIRDKVINLALNNQREQATALFYAQATTPAAVVVENIDKLFELKETGGVAKSEEYGNFTNKTVSTMLTMILVAMALAIALGFFIAMIISKPIRSLVTAAEQIAEGDLNIEIEQKTKDEVGMLAGSFKKMSNNLNEVMYNISSAAEQVASGSRQVSESSMALSQGATEQASSIEQLTASLEEISTQTAQNAENANQANILAATAKTNASQGNDQMQHMLSAMEEINESSGNISKIIKVIDEIAFQTNILALNAAVEAARAGQHGKGFAVVAEEVRNLAARSASAAKETTDMIEGSIKKVEGGTKIANETALALNSIVEDVSQVANLVGDIAVASNEQSAGIAQINQGIMQVSQVVQTNSATSEESAAASEELSSQAEMLKELVSRFQLRKTNTSFNNMEELSPEVLQLLESFNQKKKMTMPLQENSPAEGAKLKIKLSDQEFGKY